MENPCIVRALHAYNPVNNDELKLDKGDLITVTDKDEGGWWEGTLNGKTGWFPSNYVTDVTIELKNGVEVGEVGQTSNGTSSTSPSSFASLDVSISSPERAEYKLMVIADIIESENAHIMELQGMWDNYLQPLKAAEILKPADYEVLIGNIPEVLQNHTHILTQIKKEQTKPRKDQRIGKIFLESALKIETVYKCYCSNHPRAAQVIEKYKDKLQEFMESKGARQPGILVLIVACAQPFRRLQKYPTMLQELERHTEESHKDRGDLQRSIEYYKQIDKTCSALRKQKEMELEVLSGAIKGWEGSDISTLGVIHYMHAVLASTTRGGLVDLQPRYFVLFSNTLLILTYTSENNSLFYEGKIPIGGILLTNVPDSDNIVNAFEIAGPMLEPILVKCASKEIKDTWLEHLTKILKINRFPSHASAPQQSFAHLAPPVQAWNIARLRPTPPFNPFLNECLKNCSRSRVAINKADKSTSLPSMSSLQIHQGNLGNNNFSSTAPVVTNEEDLAVLNIVDAFCTKTRHISASIPTHNIVKPIQAQTSASVEKLPRTLIDLVVMLGEEVKSLKSQVVNLSGKLDEEQKSRESLKACISKLAEKV